MKQLTLDPFEKKTKNPNLKYMFFPDIQPVLQIPITAHLHVFLLSQTARNYLATIISIKTSSLVHTIMLDFFQTQQYTGPAKVRLHVVIVELITACTVVLLNISLTSFVKGFVNLHIFIDKLLTGLQLYFTLKSEWRNNHDDNKNHCWKYLTS